MSANPAHREAVLSDPVCDAARRLLARLNGTAKYVEGSAYFDTADVRLVAEAVIEARSANTAETRAGSDRDWERRYVVLCDLDAPDIAPCGLIVDRGDHVQVRLPGDGWGLRERWDEPIVGEIQPDSTCRTWTPTDSEYFDRVVYAFSRSFVVIDPAANLARREAVLHAEVVRLRHTLEEAQAAPARERTERHD